MRRKTGERATCTRCGQELEWVGYWWDRAGSIRCVPWIEGGEVRKPRRYARHTVKATARKVRA